jgi:hypothetical protein
MSANPKPDRHEMSNLKSYASYRKKEKRKKKKGTGFVFPTLAERLLKWRHQNWRRQWM